MIVHRQEIAAGITLRIVAVDGQGSVQATARVVHGAGPGQFRLVPDAGFRVLADPVAYELVMRHVVPYLVDQRINLTRMLSAAIDNAGGALRVPKALLENPRPQVNADFGEESDADVVLRIEGPRAQFNASEAAAPEEPRRILVVPG